MLYLYLQKKKRSQLPGPLKKFRPFVKKKSRTHENYGCIHPPIFSHIPLSSVIPDPLHLYLRISDQLIRQLILFLRTADNLGKNKKIVDKSKCQNIKEFECFVQELGFDWKFFIDKSSQLSYPDFTGPQHDNTETHRVRALLWKRSPETWQY